MIYGLYPDQGSARGGDQVTILGANLGGANDPDVGRVLFNGRDAQFVSQSPDGNQLVVITPAYGPDPLQTNTLVTVEVRTPGGVATRSNGFLYKADEPEPSISGVAPAAGPVDGGTRVTVFGSGFQFPARVFFTAGSLEKEAEVLEVRDDTSFADNDEIVCVTPDFSGLTAQTPFTAAIRVLNVNTGRDGSLEAAFTYGDRLFISGNTPTEGKTDTEVTIFGSGFVPPLLVDFLGFTPPLRVDPTSISGSQMVVVMTQPNQLRCTDTTGQFRVTLVESPLAPVQGGGFTFLGEGPTLYSISPAVVNETGGGAGVSPASAVITGDNFRESVRVEFDDTPLFASWIEVLGETTINVNQLPSPNDLGLVFDTVACVNGDGVAGRRRVPTPVDVTVTNTAGNCSDTLTGAITYQPQTSECVVDPNIVLVPAAGSTITLPGTGAGTCSAFEQVTVRNTGGSNLDWTAGITGPFSFSGSSGDLSRGGTVVPGASSTLEVYFCPTVDDNSNQFGQVQFLSNDPDDNPVTLTLQGQEAAGQLVVNPADLNYPATQGGTCSAPQQATVRNAGFDDLNYTASLTGRFYFDAGGTSQGPMAGNLAAGSETLVDVYFCPNVGATGTLTGQLTVDSDDPVNPTDTVNLSGNSGAPDISLSPGTVTFPDPVPAVWPGGCSDAEQLTISNAPGASDDLDYGLTLIGDFYLNDNGTGQGPLIGTLAPGANRVVDLYFCPALGQTGQVTGTARVTSNDPDTPVATADLVGTATSPEIDVTPTAINFTPNPSDEVPAGSCSAPLAVRIENVAPPASLVLQYAVTITGPYFLNSDGTGQNIAGQVSIGQFKDIDVYFCPAVDDNNIQTGVFRVDSNDPSEPTTNVQLTGKEAEPNIVTTPADGGLLTLPATAFPGCSAYTPITVDNTGYADLIFSAAISGAGFEFQNPYANVVVAPGGTTNVNVRFCPTADDGQLYTGSVTITSNDVTDPTVTVNLEGQEN